MKKSDERAINLWNQVKIPPELWNQNQYSIEKKFWVVAIIGFNCLYFNPVEGGWGWGSFKKWSEINQYHWQNDFIHYVVFQTLYKIDQG